VRLKEKGVATEVRRGRRAASPAARRRCAPRWPSAPTARSWCETDVELQPLAVAKLLKALVDKERPGSSSSASRRSTTTATRPGQMLAALAGRPQATFASQGRGRRRQGAGHARGRWRPRDAWRIELPAVVTTDLRLNEPRYVTLPNIMKAKKKPLETRQARRPRRGRGAAPQDAEGGRAAQAQRRHQGARRRPRWSTSSRTKRR
jgi:electron transfer flavoprotein beta subunit